MEISTELRKYFAITSFGNGVVERKIIRYSQWRFGAFSNLPRLGNEGLAVSAKIRAFEIVTDFAEAQENKLQYFWIQILSSGRWLACLRKAGFLLKC